jgi:hypothetical protein
MSACPNRLTDLKKNMNVSKMTKLYNTCFFKMVPVIVTFEIMYPAASTESPI